MSTTLGWVQAGCLVVAGLAALTVAGAAAIPDVAPAAMTMGTMDDLLGISRFEDQATCSFWAVNMSNPAEEIERDFACGFYWDWSVHENQTAYVHEVLLDRDRGQVFQVPEMERGTMSEWYHVDAHMLTEDALSFTEAGPGAGVLMPPPSSQGNLTMGWVSSGGQKHAPEHLVAARDLQQTGTKTIDGIETRVWESTIDRQRTTWHGYDIYLSEDVSLASDPRTGWILEMDRHVLVEMTPTQMGKAFGVQLPVDDRGEPRPIMELEYQSTDEGRAQHVEEDRFFIDLVTPIEEHRTIAGIAAVPAASLGSIGLVVTSYRVRG